MISLMEGLVAHLCMLVHVCERERERERERDYKAQVACAEHEAQLWQGETNK